MRTLVIALLVIGSSVAEAAPLTVELQEPAFRRLEAATKDFPIHVTRPEVRMDGTACFDAVGVRNLDLTTRIGQLTVTPRDGALEIRVAIPRLEMIGNLFAEGGFPCPDVDEPVNPMVLEDVVVIARVAPSVTPEGKLLLALAAPVETTVGAASIAGPSDFVIGLIEDYDLLRGTLAPMAAEMGIAEGLAFAEEAIESRRAGALMGVGYSLRFDAAAAHAAGVSITADLQPRADGAPAACLPADAIRPAFASVAAPVVPAGAAPGSGAVVAAPGVFLGDTVAAAWWAGLFCGDLTMDVPEVLEETLERLTYGAAGPLSIRYGLREKPVFTQSGADLHATFTGATLIIDGTKGTVLSASVTIVLRGRVRTEEDTRLLRATLEEMSVTVDRLDSKLHATAEDAEELVRFLEEDFPAQFRDGVQDLPVADGLLFSSLGTMVVDQLGLGSDVVSGLSFYLMSDPELDVLAPDTAIGDVREDGVSGIAVDFSATDDRPGTIVYSWSADGGPWSAWSRDPLARLDLAPGDHVIEAQARDRWGNVDPTPASLSVTIADRRDLGCACSTAPSATPPLGAIVLLFAGALALRRRAAAVVFLLLLAPTARAQETGVLPEGRFRASIGLLTFLHSSPAATTGTTVEIPTGYPALGVDVTAWEKHRMQAEVLAPSVLWGATRDLTVGAALPIFLRAHVDVQKFEVRALGLDITEETQASLMEAGFRDPSGGDEPMSDWKGSGVGDLVLIARWRVKKTRTHAWAVTGGLDLPTGRRDDPRLLTDFGFGDGHASVFGDGAIEVRRGRFVGGALAGYRANLPGRAEARPVGSPTVVYVRDPGDVVRAGVTARGLTRSLLLNGSLTVEHHFPDAGAVSLPDQRGTAVLASGSIGYSSIRSFLRGGFPVPGALSLVATRMESSNTRLRGSQLELRAETYF